jgi:membrane protein YqaA with SNARE-associated domain
MEPVTAYLTLFAASFLAATILPAQSEAVLFALLTTGTYSPALLLMIASIGNILGACVNRVLGRFIVRFEDRRWFPLRREKIAKAETWYRRYGRWSLLLSWLPIIGDPLTVVAGVLREPFPIFLLLVTIAKVSRYAVIVILENGWIS